MIVKAGLLLFRTQNGTKELMFVRARGKPFYVFPGGKQEASESIEQALHRELMEELGTKAQDIHEIGVVSGKTPDDRGLTMHLYSAKLVGEPKPGAEITEIAWMSRETALARSDEMTPMTLEHVMPFLAQNNLW